MNGYLSENKYHAEVGFFQDNHEGERICGDMFLSKRIPDEDRVLCVLSDGIGHGIRANIFATLTASISLNISLEHKDTSLIADVLMKALPVFSSRNTSYATYTIIDISLSDELVSVLEYENPQTIILRDNRIYEPEWKQVQYEEKNTDNRRLNLRECSFVPQLEDRIIFCTDGVTQSGLSRGKSMGWGRNSLIRFVRETVEETPRISASELSKKIVKKASANDMHIPKDDISCGVIYFRNPRKTLLCTGPPFDMEKDREFAMILRNFKGKRIISGATTSEIISRELERELTNVPVTDPSLPPASRMDCIDLVTEGVLTLNKVIHILNRLNIHIQAHQQLGDGPADEICRILLNSDEIYILAGTKINESHHDPRLPVEVEFRKNLIKRLEKVLLEKFLKVVIINYM